VVIGHPNEKENPLRGSFTNSAGMGPKEEILLRGEEREKKKLARVKVTRKREEPGLQTKGCTQEIVKQREDPSRKSDKKKDKAWKNPG